MLLGRITDGQYCKKAKNALKDEGEAKVYE
jgi:hypothetical protein